MNNVLFPDSVTILEQLLCGGIISDFTIRPTCYFNIYVWAAHD